MLDTIISILYDSSMPDEKFKPDYKLLRVRFDDERRKQVEEEVERLRLSGYSELLRRVWDEWYRENQAS